MRSLSGLLSVAAIPVVGVIAARRRGPIAGMSAVVVISVMPYVTRYATEARMYALVILLVAVGWYLVDRLVDGEGGVGAAIGLAVTGSMLLYSHYWAIWILATTGVGLLWCAWRAGNASRRRGALLGAGALVVAGITFVPWLPVMLDQLAHTGTPWGEPQRPSQSAAVALLDLAGGGVASESVIGAVLLAILIVLGLMGRPASTDRIVLHIRTVPGVRPALIVAGAALGVGMTVAFITGATFASRYAAIAVPVIVVAAGLGLVTTPTARSRLVLTACTVAIFGGAAILGAVDDRTQGGEVASAINSASTAGDVVVMCPDQLGPAATRTLRDDVVVITHPSSGDGRFVDWRDYGERNAAGDPAASASEALSTAGDNAVWLVWNSGYETYGSQCEALRDALAAARPAALVIAARPANVFEPMWLERFAPAS